LRTREWNRLPDDAPNPEQQAIYRQRVQLVNEMLPYLSRRERQCVCLRAQGLLYREIAAVLEIPLTAAVDRVRRGVQKLARRARAARH
jgi:RNA polymerase sigma-70 factor, ECF subfamily